MLKVDIEVTFESQIRVDDAQRIKNTMKIHSIAIRNFRRLERVEIGIEEGETVFVGPNNSGKTSATAVFRCFLSNRDFKVHDFSVARVADIDMFGDSGDKEHLPAIELDIWFSIDVNSIAFGRAFSLLPRLSDEFDRLGIRMRFEANDPEKLIAEYSAAYPKCEDGKRTRTLSQFLATDTNLKRHFDITYHSLERTGDELVASLLEEREGRRLLLDLVRVDFVDAQRNVDDDETHRSNRLSAAFAAFYRKNLEQAEAAESAHSVIDENNQKLTEHYDKHFDGLMAIIKGLGVPSINDRDLKIVSSLSPETALRGSTDLLYVDAHRNHELPEVYNGLGFKNLIYMAIQVSHFHLQWMRTDENRPLCQIIFIEEPEVHLHAQVQQTFIANIWNIISNAAKESGDESLVPQLVVTTHSSHILDTVDFAKARYFRRCELEGEDRNVAATLNASQVHSLRNFQPAAVEIEGQQTDEEGALNFLKRYLKLTHCDLFFADAAILVEGTVEKLLLPRMIEMAAPRLSSDYIATLEVGGAYAHRFTALLKFLNIPYLVITDIDSVEAAGNHKVCRGDVPDALTSNASLKQFFDVTTVAELAALTTEQRENAEEDRFVAFQNDVQVEDGQNQLQMRPRTIEEAFVFQNFGLFRNGEMDLGIALPATLPDAYEAIHVRIKSAAFKKTEFALNVLAAAQEWETPLYITEGLKWLEARLANNATVQPPTRT